MFYSSSSSSPSFSQDLQIVSYEKSDLLRWEDILWGCLTRERKLLTETQAHLDEANTAVIDLHL